MGWLTPIWTIVCPGLPCSQPPDSQADRLAQKVEGGTAVFRREGEYWTVEHGDGALRLRDSKGLGYLATLFANPDVELAAADLVGGVSSGGGDAGELLDDTAKAAHRERLRELEAELEEAESWGDPERVAAAREELDFISQELASAVGLGGRDRQAASGSARGPANLTPAPGAAPRDPPAGIMSALKRIGENDDGLGRRLEAAINTGAFCSYRPMPGLEV